MKSSRKSYVGRQFGRLLVTEDIYGKPRKVRARCSCGNEKVFHWSNLYAGVSRSCGCLNAVLFRARVTKHGLSKSRAYRRWFQMVRRCTRPSDPAYPDYGGRGITVCAAWMVFETFAADMGAQPPRHSIDRVDNDGGYWCGKCAECVSLGRPANCRWATHKVQAGNTRRNVRLTYKGRTMLAIDWAKEIGISRQAFEQRIRAGWSTEQICSTPPHRVSRSLQGLVPGRLRLHFNGETKSLTEWAEQLGLKAGTIRARLRAGKTVEQALHIGRFSKWEAA